MAVGSKNPVKVEAVRKAFSNYFEEPEVLAMEVESEVPRHPFGEDILRGAIHRALEAVEKTDADFGVGLESGTLEYGGFVFNCGWCAIADRSREIHAGSSGWWECPPILYEELRRGRELGEVVDDLIGRKGVDEKEGAIGVYSRGLLTREHIGMDSVVLALIPLLNRETYEKRRSKAKSTDPKQ